MELNLNFEINYCSFTSISNSTSICKSVTISNVELFTTTEYPTINDNESSEAAFQSLPLVNHVLRNGSFHERWQIFTKQYLLRSVPWTLILLFLYLIVVMVGLIGNSLVILAFIARPHMRTVINFFILNLAIADLVAVLFCSFGNFLTNTIRPWILGSFMCKLLAYIQGMSVCASAYLLVAISVDRCMAIYRPLLQPAGLRRRQVIYAIILIWSLALLLPLPWAATLTLVEEKGVTYCTELWGEELHGNIYFLCVNVFIFYVLPTILLVVTNTMICIRVNRRQEPEAAANNSVSAVSYVVHSKTRNEVRRMLGIVTLIFLLSWLPLYILVIRYRYFRTGKAEMKMMHEVLPFAQWLAIANSCINPLIYGFLNGNFQRVFKSMMPCLHKIFPKANPPAVPVRAHNEEWMELRQ